jgi:flagellar protein FlbD
VILVTRLNRVEQFYVNEDMIEFIEETPDTVISLDSGKKIVVLESAETVIERLRAEKRKVLLGRETGDFYRSPRDEA